MRFANGLLLAATLCVVVPSSALTAGALEPVRVTSGPLGVAVFWDVNVALKKHFFEEEGFKPEFLQTNGSPQAMQMLVSHQLEWAVAQPEPVLAARDKGATDIVVISAPLSAPDWYLVGNKATSSAADLKGKTIGLSALKVTEAWMTRDWLQTKGLNKVDWTAIQVGTSPQKFAALTNGSIAAAPLLQPTALAAVENSGFHLLADYSKIFSDIVPVVHVTSKSWAEQNDHGKRMSRLIQKAHSWLCDPANKAEGVKLLAMPSHQSEALIGKVWDIYCLGKAPFASAAVSIPGVEKVVQNMLADGELTKPETPSEFMLPEKDGGLWKRSSDATDSAHPGASK